MPTQIICEELTPDQWMRLRDVRLASLFESPHAFGGNLEVESNRDQSQWVEQFSKLTYIVASLEEKDIGVMSIEVLDGDFDATCWVGGCWSHPNYRGVGVMRAMFNYMDSQAQFRDWATQGLGVWIDNFSAIAAYEKLGFIKMGEPQNSTRVPGKFYQRMIRQASIGEGHKP